MGGLNRTIVITTLSLRTMRQRAGASAVAVVGVAGVVLVFVAVLSIADGFQAAINGAGSPDTAIIMRGGSDSELSSALALADTRIIKDADGVDASPRTASQCAKVERPVRRLLRLRAPLSFLRKATDPSARPARGAGAAPVSRSPSASPAPANPGGAPWRTPAATPPYHRPHRPRQQDRPTGISMPGEAAHGPRSPTRR